MAISEATLNIIIMAFKLTCTFFAIYYSIVQAERYFQNEDASIVSFKPFNQHIEDNYPDLTICIEGGQFKKRALDEFQISASDLSSILKGTIPANTVTNTTFHKIAVMNSSHYFTSLSDIIHMFTAKTNQPILVYDKKKHGVNGSDSLLSSLFSVTHQEPDLVCLTRHGISDEGTLIARKEDYIILDFSEFDWEINIEIYLHQPGQLIQHFMSPSYQRTLSKSSEHIDLNIAGITTLRKRSRKSAPCTKSTRNDGIQLMIRVVKELNCLPGFWTSLFDNTGFYKLCATTNELKRAAEMIEYEIINMSKETQPCIAMLIPFSMQHKILNEGFFVTRIHVSVRYSSTEYQEIVNVRGFDFDSMFSGIGGFVGIFLGYSLLQIADILNLATLQKISNIFGTFTTFLWISLTSLFSKGKFLQ